MRGGRRQLYSDVTNGPSLDSTSVSNVFLLEGRQLKLVRLVLLDVDSPVTGTNSRGRSNASPSIKCDAMLYFDMNSQYHTPAESVTEIKSVEDRNTSDFFGCTAVVLSTGSDPDETVYHGPGSTNYESWNSVVAAGVKLFPRRHSRAELDAVLAYLVQKVEARENRRSG